jgi:DNA-binding MarR family transcriptional regulator
MATDRRAPDEVVAASLARIRRDQQARRLQRAAASDGDRPATLADAARFRCLDALDGHPEGLAVSAVAERIGVDRPRASRLTTELATSGLVTIEADADDGRYRRVRLTDAGQRAVDAAHDRRRRVVRQALAGFSAEDAAAFADLLERFVDAWPSEPA